MDKEQYILTCLQEECAEVIHIISKIKRFGITDHHPNTGIENKVSLSNELVDLIAVTEMTIHEVMQDHLSSYYHCDAIQDKKRKVKKFMEYSKSRGCLTNE